MRSGVTLVEVLGALAILAWLVSAMLLAQARHLRQATIAEHRLKAVAAANLLMTHWWESQNDIRVSSDGAVEEEPTLSWSTHLVTSPAAKKLGLRVVRLEVRETSATSLTTEALASVEFVLAESPNNKTSNEGGKDVAYGY